MELTSRGLPITYGFGRSCPKIGIRPIVENNADRAA
jgi:hypothetical protein